MNLLALTHPDLVFINPPQRTPEAVIRWLTGAARRAEGHQRSRGIYRKRFTT